MQLSSLTETVFLVTGVAHLCAVLALCWDLYRGRRGRRGALVIDPLVCFAVAAGAAVAAGHSPGTVLAVAGVEALGLTVIAGAAANFWPAGVLAWGTLLVSTVAGTAVGFTQLWRSPLSALSLGLLWFVAIVGVVRTPNSLMQLFENWEVALRRRWQRSLDPRLGWTPGPDAPVVCIQVPTYAEPPEIVIATLDALSRLEYPAFEVLVIDNNTRDEELWRPVEAHCERLGERFRFVHVEGITGAKAGALNWARPLLHPRTELVALVDADYQVHPRWLADTAGLFEDTTLGFVQCPHAYRDFRDSRYGRMANTAYEWAQVTEMVSRNEHGAGITVGTMSLVRLTTLDAAGGWAEWCQTEDSEFAIRAHAVGYSSIFLNRAYGWGLIPETLAELKKQRFRWTYGPGQEFKAHARLYLPSWLGGRPSLLTRPQRIRHGHYGLVVLMTGLGVLTLPVSLTLLASMFAHHEAPVLAPSLLLPFFAMMAARRAMRWIQYRVEAGVGTRQFIGGSIALLAVKPTMSTAAFSVLLGRPALWQRTNKFRTPPARFRFLHDARPELVMGAGCLLVAAAVPVLLPGGIATALFALGFVWQAIVYGCAPLLSLLAERDIRARSTVVPQPAELSEASV